MIVFNSFRFHRSSKPSLVCNVVRKKKQCKGTARQAIDTNSFVFVEGMCCDAHEIGDDKQTVLSLRVTDAESAVEKVANCGSSSICFTIQTEKNRNR
jgi:hypothetical protein